MKIKTTLLIFLVVILVIPLSADALVSQKQKTVNSNTEDLEVILEIEGSGRNKKIDVYLKNNGDTALEVSFPHLPGGGFEVYKNNLVLYREPQVHMEVIGGATLEPDEQVLVYTNEGYEKIPILFGSFWIRGYVSLLGGDTLYSESTDITLPVSKSIQRSFFLERFPFLAQILELITS